MAHIDDGTTQRANLDFIRASMREPLLSHDDERELAQRWRDRGDTAALHRLVRAYARLVVAAARRFRQFGLPLGDLMQEGNIGLLQAARRFEPAREVRFSTYATWWIRASMQDFVLRNWSIVRTGTTAAQKALFFNFRRLRMRIEKASGHPLGAEDRIAIATELRIDPCEVSEMEQRLASRDQSINIAASDDGSGEWGDRLADARPNPEDFAIGISGHRARRAWLSEALAGLNPRERTIIAARRLADRAATLEELGHGLGISKERVRQLESRALGKLRQSLSQHIDQLGDIMPDMPAA